MKQVLEYLKKNDKNKTAVICENESITYGELISKSKLVGSNLINKVKIKSNTGEYSIDISGKDISIEVTDADMNISAYLFNYFKNKGYNVNDVCFCLTDFMRNPIVKDYTDFDYSLLDSLSYMFIY